jgi:hypothetical protein
MSENKVCFRSNINKHGRARRTKARNVVAFLGPIVLYALHKYYPVSSIIMGSVAFLFTVAGMFCHLQVSRDTCAVLAFKGAREKDDAPVADKFERVTDKDVDRASRQVANSIVRDSLIAAVLVGGAAAYFL